MTRGQQVPSAAGMPPRRLCPLLTREQHPASVTGGAGGLPAKTEPELLCAAPVSQALGGALAPQPVWMAWRGWEAGPEAAGRVSALPRSSWRRPWPGRRFFPGDRARWLLACRAPSPPVSTGLLPPPPVPGPACSPRLSSALFGPEDARCGHLPSQEVAPTRLGLELLGSRQPQLFWARALLGQTAFAQPEAAHSLCCWPGLGNNLISRNRGLSATAAPALPSRSAERVERCPLRPMGCEVHRALRSQRMDCASRPLPTR